MFEFYFESLVDVFYKDRMDEKMKCIVRREGYVKIIMFMESYNRKCYKN